MLSATLQQGLSEYAVGEKIRALRLKKKMGLVELGTHTGLSPALLSKIERGRLFPTLPTLLRIALVFSVGLDFFFSGSRDKPLVAVVRKKDRVALPDRPGVRAGRVSLRVARLPGDRAAIQFLLRGVPSRSARRRSAGTTIRASSSFTRCRAP